MSDYWVTQDRVSPQWKPKTLREKLCQQEPHAPDDQTREAMSQLIAILDLHRPLGSDGKHGDLHTPTCGCGCGARIDGREWQQRAEQAEAAIQRVREACAKWQDYDAYDRATAPYLLTISKDEAARVILVALDGDRDRAFEAEAAIQRVREVLERYRTSPYSEMSQTDALGAVGRALDGLQDEGVQR